MGKKECELRLSNDGQMISGKVYHDNGKLKLERNLVMISFIVPFSTIQKGKFLNLNEKMGCGKYKK